jgi:hypothetical protein
MTKHERKREKTFAELAAEIPVPASNMDPPLVYQSPIGNGEWIDPQGTRWKRRGLGNLDARAVDRLVVKPDVRVVLFSLDEVTEVDAAKRAEFWREIRPYYLHLVDLPPNDNTDYEAAEFRDADGHKMVIFQQSC